MPFEEIAFEAELCRQEPTDAEEVARELCGEDPSTKTARIEELRHMIYERGECHPHRMDDAYLLRFLRARHGVPKRAHRLLVRYIEFREQHAHLYRDVKWLSLRRLGHVFEGVLYDRPDVGRLIICRLGLWDPDIIPADDLIRACLLLLEIGIMQPKLQILGGTALFDCEGLTMKQMRQLSPSIAMQAMNVMGWSFPLHQRGVHVVHCSRVLEALFSVSRRLAPAQLWENVYFHGSNLKSLQRYIPAACLPDRYGGRRRSVSLQRWLDKILQYADKEFHHEMANLGYAN